MRESPKAEATATEGCVHHWIIEPPGKATSEARCKFCGSEREFYNYDERTTYAAHTGSEKKKKRQNAPHSYA